MTPEQLKASVLLYAMQGKLTEHKEEDGSASDLLPFLHIDPKIEANEPPYDIPENWLWIPIGNLGESTDTDSFSDGPFGSNLKTVHYINKPEVRIIQLSNIGEEGWRDKNVKYTSYKHLDEVIPRCEVQPGDFVIAKMMPAGRTIEVPNLGTRITLGSDAMKFVPNKCLDKQYLLWAMHSQVFLEQVYAEAHGITRVRTTLNGVKTYVLPIPPLEEQHRIVAKIEELLPYIDRYAEAYEKLEQFNAKFPEDMKKSILQYAIQGKLVEQRPEEGTAEELYQQIQEKKQRLIKEGKIKKEKSLAEISEDEIPFDIPETWKWVRLKSVMSVYGGKRIPAGKKLTKDNTGHIYIRVSDMKNGSVSNADIHYVPEDVYPQIQKYTISKEDVYITVAGTIGRVGVIPDEFDNANLTENADKLVIYSLYKTYVMYLMDSPVIQKQITDATTKVGQPKLAIKRIEDMLVPLPPLQEQHRIVAKIEELLQKVHHNDSKFTADKKAVDR